MSRASRWWRALRWPVIGGLGAASLSMGAIGFHAHARDAGLDPSVFDSVYRSIQLFVLEWNGFAAPVPILLQIARFVAPLMAGLAAAQAVAVLFRDELDRIGLRLFARRHTIVCGFGERGQMLAANLAAAGWRVAVIDPVKRHRPAPRSITMFLGEPSDEAILRRAGLANAAHLVAVGGTDAANAAVVRAARPAGAPQLTIHMHVDDAQLAALLRTESVMSGSEAEPVVEFFNMHERAAALLLDRLAGLPEQVLIVGDGPLAERLVVEIGRRCRHGADACSVDMIGPNASRSVQRIEQRFQGLRGVIDIRPRDIEPTDVRDVLDPGSIPGLVVVAMDDAAAGVTVGLEVVQALKRRSADDQVVRVMVRTDQASTLAELAGQALGGEAGIAFDPFDAVSGVLTPDLLAGGVIESIARAVHDVYRGVSPGEGPAHSGEAPASWEDTDEQSRAASRAAASSIGAHVRSIGCDLVPLTRFEAVAIRFTPAEVELMSILEHQRWLDWKLRHGFELGSPRSQRLNPQMMGWFELAAAVQERVREAIRLLPDVLELAGQQVVRLDRSPARSLHEDYMRRRREAGDTPETNPSLVSWDRLPETLKASNRDQIAHVRVKLLSIGCDMRLGKHTPLARLEPDEIEGLARMEHDRWWAHRVFDGWQPGPVKDVEARVSPHLVPWAELDDSVREIDRDFVRSIPELVDSMGSHITRLVDGPGSHR